MSFYAVANGRNCGIFNTWNECNAQVEGFSNARFKKFKTKQEAEQFCIENAPKTSSSNTQGNKTSLNSCQKGSSKTNFQSNKPKTTKFVNNSSKFSHYKPGNSNSTDAIVYTDGACIENGKRGARAGKQNFNIIFYIINFCFILGIGIYWGENDEFNVSQPLKGRQTNNRAEIQAAVLAIQQAKKRGYKSLTIRTDSMFMINSITAWIDKWIRTNWQLSTGGPVKNKEDFINLLDAMKGIDVHWEKVRAHCGIKGNEMADKFARDGVLKN